MYISLRLRHLFLSQAYATMEYDSFTPEISTKHSILTVNGMVSGRWPSVLRRSNTGGVFSTWNSDASTLVWCPILIMLPPYVWTQSLEELCDGTRIICRSLRKKTNTFIRFPARPSSRIASYARSVFTSDARRSFHNFVYYGIVLKLLIETIALKCPFAQLDSLTTICAHRITLTNYSTM